MKIAEDKAGKKLLNRDVLNYKVIPFDVDEFARKYVESIRS
jgi:hypothetical protein